MVGVDRDALGDFLRSRRERLRPEDVGLVPGPRRRTPGLRRDEVALLATMSTDYYERIEQGRGPQPSPSMLGAIARALRLTRDERDHVYVLAGHAAPAAYVSLGYADPGLMTILDALAPTVPAMITDDLEGVLAQNPLNVALLGRLTDLGGFEPSFLWHWFTDERYRRLYAENDRDQLTRAYVADFRAAVARRGADAEARGAGRRAAGGERGVPGGLGAAGGGGQAHDPQGAGPRAGRPARPRVRRRRQPALGPAPRALPGPPGDGHRRAAGDAGRARDAGVRRGRLRATTSVAA